MTFRHERLPNGLEIVAEVTDYDLDRTLDRDKVEIEVEAPDRSRGSCRFLLGSVDVMGYVWERMARGIPYTQAAATA